MAVQPGQLRLLVALSLLIVVGLTYSFVALTPLREWVVPGYLSSETRSMQKQALHTADSLARVLDSQRRYMDNLKAVLRGELPAGSVEALPSFSTPNQTSISLSASSSNALDSLRSQVTAEDEFALVTAAALEESGLLLAPVDGRISSPWDPNIGHLGVDLVAQEGSPVRCVADGTVIFSGYSSNGGHTVMVQHTNDRLSVYMHNSRLEVQSGDLVKRGDLLAIIGDSGDHSSGPHLHFEWWESGVAVNPVLRISLD